MPGVGPRCGAVPGVPEHPRVLWFSVLPQEGCCGCGRPGAPARTPRRTSCRCASCWRASCARGSDVSDPWSPGGRWQSPRASGEGSALPFSRRTRLGLPQTGLLALAGAASRGDLRPVSVPELVWGDNLSCLSRRPHPKEPGCGQDLPCAAKAASPLPKQAELSVRQHPQRRGL